MNRYLQRTELIEETSSGEANAFLCALVTILEMTLGEHLRSIFVVGSYAEGTNFSDSEIDYCLLWNQSSSQDTWRKGNSLITHLSSVSKFETDPMYYGTDTPFYNAANPGHPMPCGAVLRLAIKKHSLLLWGEDIRSKVALGGTEDFLKDVLAAPLNWIKQRNYGTLDARIVYPLGDPSPEKENRGYGDLRDVAIFVIHIARALVFLETNEFLFNKREVPAAYERHVGGVWNELVQRVQDARASAIDELEKLQIHMSACQKLTEFQNYFLNRLASKGIDAG